jgi:hypothetical protein
MGNYNKIQLAFKKTRQRKDRKSKKEKTTNNKRKKKTRTMGGFFSCVEFPTAICAEVNQDEGSFVAAIFLYGIVTIAWGMSIRHFADKQKQAKVKEILKLETVKGVRDENVWLGVEIVWVISAAMLGLAMAFIAVASHYPLWVRIIIFSFYGGGLAFDLLFSKLFHEQGRLGWGLICYVFAWLLHTANWVFWLITVARDRFHLVLVRRGVGIAALVLLGVYLVCGLFMFYRFFMYWYRGPPAEKAAATGKPLFTAAPTKKKKAGNR